MGTEAAFHPIEEYMMHVEEQFQHLARRVHIDKKRVYLATDDPSLLQEAKTKSVSSMLSVWPLSFTCLMTGSVLLSLPGIQTMSSSVITPSRGRQVFTTATLRTPSEESSWTSTSFHRPTSWSAPSPHRSETCTDRCTFICFHTKQKLGFDVVMKAV